MTINQHIFAQRHSLPMARLVWDEPHLKALLRIPRYPLRLIQSPPWGQWIHERGGLAAVRSGLTACDELSEPQRRLLAVVLAHPERPLEFHALELHVSAPTYRRQLAGMLPCLLRHLNSWAPPPAALLADHGLPGRAGQGGLPAERSELFGRQAELATLLRLLGDPGCRLLTLTGPGGVGKTRLALRALHALGDRSRHGICFLSLAHITSAELIPPLLLQARAFPEADHYVGLDNFYAALYEHELLVVMDNLEQIAGAGAFIGACLDNLPRLRVLATSRTPLRLYGEHELNLLPLTTPGAGQQISVDAALEFPAVRLFVERARAANPRFGLDEQNLAEVLTICRALDGMPLALELAAAHMRRRSPAAISALIQRQAVALSADIADLPERHQLLRKTIAWSYNLLDARAQRLFRRLGVFPESWTLAQAERICKLDPDDGWQGERLLELLCDHQLIRHEEGPLNSSRWQMLALLREYAREQLEASGELERLRDAHAGYCLQLVLETGDLRLPKGEEAIELIDLAIADISNVCAAIEWLLARDQLEDAATLVGWFMPILQGRLPLLLYQRWLEHLYAAQERLSPTMRVTMLFTLGMTMIQAGQVIRAEEYLAEGLEQAQRCGDHQGLLDCLYLRARNALDRGDREAARVRFEQLLALADADLDSGIVNSASMALGIILLQQGEAARAAGIFEACLARQRAQEDEFGVAFALAALGWVSRYDQQYDRARDYLQRSLALFRQLRSVGMVAGSLSDLGTVAMRQGSLEEAAGLLREALNLYWETQTTPGVKLTLERFAELSTLAGQELLAARLWGCLESLAELRHLAPLADEQQHQQQALRLARARVTLEAWDEAWRQGSATSLEGAVKLALASFSV